MNNKLMDYFKLIASIPHTSYHEKALSDEILKRALSLNLEAKQDEHNNLLVIKPATKGYEDAPVVMLQSHLDMVGEKNNDSDHNFENDPIELILDGNILRANKTTLGADDGVGVAYMMALMEDETLSHPKLELVFTVEEEVGLLGAANFDTSDLESTLCIGLDSSGENEVYVSSSGGVRAKMVKTLSFEELSSDTVKIDITGLLGGHSGGDIHLERANALRLAGIILKRSIEEYGIQHAVLLKGGLKVNAIPREASLEVAVDDVEKYQSWFQNMEKELKIQFEISDPNLTFNLSSSKTTRVIDAKNTTGMANALFMLPQGVLQKSMALEDLVITSANIGIAETTDTEFIIHTSLRATQEFVIENIMYRVKLISKNTGYDVSFNAKYPGWNYDKNSKFRERLFEVYENLRNEPMKEIATHGGVELGIWKGKMPHLDIVSLGPIMYDIHTPNEHLDVASFERTYEVLVALLNSLKRDL